MSEVLFYCVEVCVLLAELLIEAGFLLDLWAGWGQFPNWMHIIAFLLFIGREYLKQHLPFPARDSVDSQSTCYVTSNTGLPSLTDNCNKSRRELNNNMQHQGFLLRVFCIYITLCIQYFSERSILRWLWNVFTSWLCESVQSFKWPPREVSDGISGSF